jgi:hypothetical protein
VNKNGFRSLARTPALCGALTLLALTLAGCRGPANVPATPPHSAAAVAAADSPAVAALPAVPSASAAPVEKAAGGKLKNGQWHFGYTPNREATQRFLRSLEKPTLAEAGPELLTKASDDQPVLLYRALVAAYADHYGGKQWVVGKQGIGDCVSWGWHHGADVTLAVDWKLGRTSEWRESASEAIYGGARVEGAGVSRGGYMDGSYGGAAAKWVKDTGGILFRQPYADLGFDLTEYSAARAKDWGNYGCGGSRDSGRADSEAKKHPIRTVALVRNFAEAAAAIQAGYPVPVCSGQGFSSRRDEQGFARASGSWSHCMCFIGVRFDRKGLLCLNSWGPSWIDGPKWPSDQPDGSFWVDERTAARMLAGEDSFAVSGYEGFPYRDLKHGDWVQVQPGKLGKSRAIASGSTHRGDSFALSLAP